MKRFGFTTIVFAVLLFAVFPYSSSQSSPMEELEGTFEVLVATSLREKRCENIYYLKTGEERIRFSLPDNPPPNLSPGQKVKITGRWSESAGKKSFKSRKVETITSVRKSAIKKSDGSSMDDISRYFPEQYLVSGKIETVVAYVCFPDIPAPKWGKDKANNKIFFNKHSLTAYWEECSGGIMWLSGSDNTLEVWMEMPKNSSAYGYSSSEEIDHFKEFRDDVVNLLGPYVKFSNCDHLEIFRAGDNWMYDWSTNGKQTQKTDKGEFEFSSNFLTEGDVEIKNSNAVHEFTHALKRWHSNSKSVSNGQIHGYGDWWDVRGKDGQLDGLNKWALGWLKIDQIEIIATSGSFWLDQRELASSGIKLLVIILGFDEYGNAILFYLEYHRGLGEFDSQLHFENSNEAVDPQNLVLLRKHDYEEDYSSVVYVADDDGKDCLDLESQEFQDSEYGITFQVLQKTGEGADSQAEVKITLPSDYIVPTPPAPNPTPTPVLSYDMGYYGSQNGTTFHKGDKVKVEVNVTGVNEVALQADEITCQMTRSDGSFKSKTKTETSTGSFVFLIRKKHPTGDYKTSVKISKEGYVGVGFDINFKVED